MSTPSRAAFRLRAEDPYFERLVKLIPAEVLALYLTFRVSLLDWAPIWAWICLAAVVVVRIWGTREAGQNPPQAKSVVVAGVSYVLWIYATGDYLIDVAIPAAWVSATIGLWTFAVPIFYKPAG